MKNFVIGIDFGSDSVRSVIVDTENGKEISSSVHHYYRWSKGLFCNPAKNMFRQHPLDYIEGLEKSISDAIKKAPSGTAQRIVALSVDTTGSTLAPVDQDGIPLALNNDFAENPNAMFVLWKDHTAVKEAEEINITANSWGGVDYTKYVGGIYSPEWYWAKMLHVLREDEKVREKAFSWVEHCDWIPALLTDNTDPIGMKRSRCAAGHKAMWHENFDGLPSEDFLTKIDPLLSGIRNRLYKETYTSDEVFGKLSKKWADKLGLSTDVLVGVGAFDAHMGAVGGGIEPYMLCKIIGTSTCDILIAPNEEFGDTLIKGICGQVNGSVIPGMLGMEAGQSAFGDVYAWYKNLLQWPLNYYSKMNKNSSYDSLCSDINQNIIPYISKEASRLPVDESGIVAVDWFNGRRTPDANHLLKGAITGLNLASDAPRVFKALVETTAFGSKRIVERFEEEGVPIKGVIALGGVAKKDSYVMQTLSDILNMNIKIAASDQTCALGAAMFAARIAGVYSSIEDAQKKMGCGFEKEYYPNIDNVEKYESMYQKYNRIGSFLDGELVR
jgi:L-ribulokinase